MGMKCIVRKEVKKKKKKKPIPWTSERYWVLQNYNISLGLKKRESKLIFSEFTLGKLFKMLTSFLVI